MSDPRPGATITDLDPLFRSDVAGLIPDGARPNPSATARARSALIELAAADEAHERRRQRSLTRWPHRQAGHPAGQVRRRVGVGALAAGALLAVVLVVEVPGGTPTAQADARAALLTASRVAAGRPAEVARPGQYRYVRTIEERPSSFPSALMDPTGRLAGRGLGYSLTVVVTVERWTPVDGHGAGLEVTTQGHPRFATASDADRFRRQGLIDPAGHVDRRTVPSDESSLSEPGLPPYSAFQEVSTDPDALSDVVRRAGENRGPSPSYETLDVLAGLLSADAPPALVSAAYQVAARVAGVGFDAHTTDLLGRAGVSVDLTTDSGHRIELVFDPATATFLETRTGLVHPNGTWDPAPGRETSTDSLVDAVGEQP